LDLLPAHSRKPLDKIINRRTILKIFKQRFYRDTGALKNRGAAQKIWVHGDEIFNRNLLTINELGQFVEMENGNAEKIKASRVVSGGVAILNFKF